MKLNWLWEACFYNGKLAEDDPVYIIQPPDDKYSKHNDKAEWNPSSYRDFLDYFKDHKDELQWFRLKKSGETCYVVVNFRKNGYVSIFSTDGGDSVKMLVEPTKIRHAQPIYYREMQNTSVNGVFGEPECIAYVVGFQGKKDGKNYQQVVRVLA